MLNDMLSEIRQTEKVRYDRISLLYRILKKKKTQIQRIEWALPEQGVRFG